jgi:predicted flap endonuclease-1-like 5' DNA nuclease
MYHPFSILDGALASGFVLAAASCPAQETEERTGPLSLAYSLLFAAGAALAVMIAASLILWWWLTRRSAQEDARSKERHPRDSGPSPRAAIRLPAQMHRADLAPIPAIPIETTQAGSEAEPLPPDDLQRIRGIGPKTADLLRSAGILTYAQLAMTDVDGLQEILTGAGLGSIVNPATWPEQARLAAEDDWDGLKRLHQELRARR